MRSLHLKQFITGESHVFRAPRISTSLLPPFSRPARLRFGNCQLSTLLSSYSGVSGCRRQPVSQDRVVARVATLACRPASRGSVYQRHRFIGRGTASRDRSFPPSRPLAIAAGIRANHHHHHHHRLCRRHYHVRSGSPRCSRSSAIGRAVHTSRRRRRPPRRLGRLPPRSISR